MGTRQISRDTLYPALRLSTSRRDRPLSRYESCDCRYEFFGYDDYRVITPAKGRLIFSDGFVLCLALKVFEKFSNPGLVPASWKSISFFRLMWDSISLRIEIIDQALTSKEGSFANNSRVHTYQGWEVEFFRSRMTHCRLISRNTQVGAGPHSVAIRQSSRTRNAEDPGQLTPAH